MFRRLFILITCSFLFSGCLSTPPKPISSSPTSAPSEPTPYSTQEGNVAVTPGIPDPESLPTDMPATAYPVPTSSSSIEESAYPALSSTLMPVPTTSPFSDCGRTPGIPGCNSSVPRLAGHIAFYDIAENRLIGLDLQTGQGWSVSISQPNNLEWSPDGSQLLVRMNYPEDKHDEVEYLLIDKGGKLIQPLTRDKDIYWQPQGASLRTYEQRKVVRSKDGAEAWLESANDGKEVLHFRSTGTDDWETAALDGLENMPSEVYGWIPGTSNILIIQYPTSVANEASFGYEFHMFNIQTGELRSLHGIHGHISPQFTAMQEPGFAIIQLYWGLADDTLAVLDGKTGNISYPLPHVNGEVQPFSLWQIAWQPVKKKTEGTFAMMVHMTRTNLPIKQPPVSPLFPKDGIYLYNSKSSQTEMLRETPENMTGGNFYWTPEGQYLLYSLGPTNSSQNAQTSLYVRQMNTGKEWLMVDHLVNPDMGLSSISWPLIAVYIG